MISLHVIAYGRMGQGPEADLTRRYLNRIPWHTRLTELADNSKKNPLDIARSGKCPVLVVLDEKGACLSSMNLAQKLRGWFDIGRKEACFLIGNADGHTDQVRQQADLVLSFGPATWPHLLARVMLAEQLYRATTILSGHPYHRQG